MLNTNNKNKAVQPATSVTVGNPVEFSEQSAILAELQAKDDSKEKPVSPVSVPIADTIAVQPAANVPTVDAEKELLKRQLQELTAQVSAMMAVQTKPVQPSRLPVQPIVNPALVARPVGTAQAVQPAAQVAVSDVSHLLPGATVYGGSQSVPGTTDAFVAIIEAYVEIRNHPTIAAGRYISRSTGIYRLERTASYKCALEIADRLKANGQPFHVKQPGYDKGTIGKNGAIIDGIKNGWWLERTTQGTEPTRCQWVPESMYLAMRESNPEWYSYLEAMPASRQDVLIPVTVDDMAFCAMASETDDALTETVQPETATV